MSRGARDLSWPALAAVAIVVTYVAALVYYAAAAPGDPFIAIPTGDLASMGTGFGACAVVGALIIAKRPRNTVGWVLAAAGLAVAIGLAGDVHAARVALRGDVTPVAIAAAWFQGWYWYVLLPLLFVYLPLVFPTGRLPSRRWWAVAVVPGVCTGAIAFLGALAETLGSEGNVYRFDNPLGIAGLGYVEELPFFDLLGIGMMAGVIGAIVSVIVRFRRSRGVERAQMKWFLFAVSLIPLLPLAESVGSLSNVYFALVLAGLPASIGIAVLRYRLYDIDRIVNRTLVYVAVTVLLGGVYAGIAVLPTTLLDLGHSDLLVAAATLAAAAAFRPLRQRVQRFVDRRFYRSRYDRERMVESFATRLRDDVDLGSLGEDLAAAVRSSIAPTHVSLWVRP